MLGGWRIQLSATLHIIQHRIALHGIKMLLTSAFTLSTFFLSIRGAALPQNADKPLPLVIWHGLGDSFEGEGINEVAELAEAINPGTYTYLIRLGEDASADRSASFWGNVTE